MHDLFESQLAVDITFASRTAQEAFLAMMDELQSVDIQDTAATMSIACPD